MLSLTDPNTVAPAPAGPARSASADRAVPPELARVLVRGLVLCLAEDLTAWRSAVGSGEWGVGSEENGGLSPHSPLPSPHLSAANPPGPRRELAEAGRIG